MTIRLLMYIIMLAPFLAYAESNYWGRIEELSKLNTPQGNPALERYLRSLTPEQTLQAAREYCDQYQAKYTEDQWAQAGAAVGIIMAIYGDEKGGLDDKKLAPVLKIITDVKEGLFFRETLTRLLRQRYWVELTDIQRKQGREALFSVLTDKTSSRHFRSLTCREIELALAEDYRRIIHADKNVRPLRGDKAKGKNLNNIIQPGEVRLDLETRKALKTLKGEIEKITPTLTALSKDATESPEVKDQARAALKTFADLPIPPEQ